MGQAAPAGGPHRLEHPGEKPHDYFHHMLLVDPLAHGKPMRALQSTIISIAHVTATDNFFSAREALLGDLFPDFLVSAARLGPFNGVHLALLADRARTTCIIYAREHDVYLAREVQRAGAFYARWQRLSLVLSSFERAATLPTCDQRDAARTDQRATPRGGRRVTDRRSLRAC